MELWIRYGQWRLMAGCEDLWPRFCKALGAYPQRLQSKDLAPEAGDMGPAVLQYLCQLNVSITSACPSRGIQRQASTDFNPLLEACDTLDDIAGLLAAKSAGIGDQEVR